MPSRPSRRLASALVAPLLLGCTDTAAPDAGGGADAALVPSKLAVLAVAIATGSQGHGFFDNVIACTRRGVVDYHNTASGRQATIVGCDLGDGVVVDGAAEVRFARGGGDPRAISALELVGPLRVRVAGGAERTVDRLSVSGISFGVEPTVIQLVVAPVRVTTGGVTTPLDARAEPGMVFQTAGRGIGSIPNATGGVDGLDDVDVRRVALHDALALAAILFDETLESQRGEHTHALPCGTLHVLPDPVTRLVHLDAAWNGCEIGGGTFASGTFTLDWSRFDARTGELAMVVAGNLVLGGGVPRVELTRLEWGLAGVAGLPATARIAGALAAGARSRPYAFDVLIDD